jgi:hypothetical protein
MENLYKAAMDGIGAKVAMMAIRKVLRVTGTDNEKLEQIIAIVHSYENDKK